MCKGPLHSRLPRAPGSVFTGTILSTLGYTLTAMRLDDECKTFLSTHYWSPSDVVELQNGSLTVNSLARQHRQIQPSV